TSDGLWLYDGNHRSASALKLGMEIEAKIVDLTDYEEPRGRVSRKLAARGEVGPVYHGTDKKFSEFEQKPGTRYILFKEFQVQAGGFFFTDDSEYAREFGSNVMTCYLKMKKPLIREEDQYSLSKKQIKDLTYICEPCMSDGYSDMHGNTVKMIELGATATDVDETGAWLNEVVKPHGLDWNILDNQESVNRMKELGYDSTMVDEANGKYSYFVVSPDQIRIVNDKAKAVAAAAPGRALKLYHVTTVDIAKKIKAHGFKPVDQGMWKNYYAPQGRDGIYFYDDLKYSEAYAAYAEGQLFTQAVQPNRSWEESKKHLPQMAIIEVQVPENIVQTTEQKEDGFFVPTADLDKVKITGMYKYDYIPTQGRGVGNKFGAAFPTLEQVMDKSTDTNNEFDMEGLEGPEGLYQETLKFWQAQKFPLVVYRALSLNEGDKIRYKGAGLSWSLDRDEAISVAADLHFNEDIKVLEGKILSNAVDWVDTFRCWMTPLAEQEVRLKPGAKVQAAGRTITAVWRKGVKRYKLWHGGDPDLTRVPTYFTNNRKYAEEFGDAVQAYVTFNNPLVLDAMEGGGFEAEEKHVRNPQWRQEQIEKGYDGLIVVGSDAPNMPQIEAYIPFSPSQIQPVEETVIRASKDFTNFPVGETIDSWSVLQYVRSLHEGYEDDGRITQYQEFELKEVPLSSIDAPWETGQETVDQYARLTTEPPPIVLDHHGVVIDGTHRVAVATDQGATTIKAFVPIGEPESFPDEEEESLNALRGLAS